MRKLAAVAAAGVTLIGGASALAATSSDDFERNTLGPSWRVDYGNPGIVSGNLGILSGGFARVSWVASSFTADHFSEAEIAENANPAMLKQVFVRYLLPRNVRYGFHFNSEQGRWEIKYEAPAPQSKILAATSAVPAPQPGDTLRVEAAGQTISGYLNGSLILSVSDHSAQAIPYGRPGMAFRLEGGVPVSQPEPVFVSWQGGGL